MEIEIKESVYLKLVRNLNVLSEEVKKQAPKDKNPKLKLIFGTEPVIVQETKEKYVIEVVKRNGKHIYYAKTKKEAEKLNKKINKIVAEANITQHKKDTENKKAKDLYVKVKILPASGPARLSIKDAYSTKTSTIKKEIKNYKNNINLLRKEKSKLENKGELDDIEEDKLYLLRYKIKKNTEILKALENAGLEENTKLKISTKQGKAYRVTYFNAQKQKREQTAVGDIIIFYNTDLEPEPVILQKSAPTKQRSDSRELSNNIIYKTRTDDFYIISC